MSIIVTDSNSAFNLAVYHYSDDTPLNNTELMNVRGIIKDTDTQQVIVKTFGFTPEVLADDHEKLNQWIAPLVRGAQTKFYKSYEGTLLRVWWWKDKWFLSTHRKLDASKSRWGSNKSYGELFNRALVASVCEGGFDEFVKLLDTNKIYVLLLRSYKENRKVCDGADQPTLYGIGAFFRDQNFAFTQDISETKCATPEQIHIESADMLVETVYNMNPKECQGIVIMNPDGSSGKIVSLAYNLLDQLRGNVPNVLHRYVQIRWDTVKQQLFRELYPEHIAKFDEWEASMNHIVSNVLRKYIERYVNHRTAILPPEQYDLMRQLQTYYINVLRPQRQRAEMKHIWDILGTWQERDVNVLYKEYQTRKRINGNGNLMSERLRESIMTRMNRTGVPTEDVDVDVAMTEAN